MRELFLFARKPINKRLCTPGPVLKLFCVICIIILNFTDRRHLESIFFSSTKY